MNRSLQSLLDMYQSAEIVLDYLDGVSKQSFYENRQLQDAVIRRLFVIGEAANRVSEETRLALTTIEWAKIRGVRNRLVHEYDEIDLAIVWQTCHDELERLKTALSKVISSAE
ncbi:MAG: HepT-like ribonuclease domain-containing protein [Cyanobacteria bacterium J06631_12]